MSMRGNAAQAYDAYKAQWIADNGPVPVLNIIGNMHSEEGKELGILYAQGEKQSFMGPVYRRYPVVLLADGRAVEQSVDTIGLYIYVVFESLEKAQNYKRPMSIREMYDWW